MPGAAKRVTMPSATVLHRVRRAEQLLGVSLSQPDERLTLQLACRVLRETGRRQ
jgi:PucR family transcriptional regulator, purine catabolism regulatory protein